MKEPCWGPGNVRNCILEEWKHGEVSSMCAEGGMDKFIVQNCLTEDKIWMHVNINALHG